MKDDEIDPMSTGRTLRLDEMFWQNVDRPGAYLVTEEGSLIRVTPEYIGGSINGRSLPADTWMARLSDDPNSALATLRRIADESGYFVNF